MYDSGRILIATDFEENQLKDPSTVVNDWEEDSPISTLPVSVLLLDVEQEKLPAIEVETLLLV